jgi:uncharacterized OB-fold protein
MTGLLTNAMTGELLDAIAMGEEKRPVGWICPRCGQVNAPHVDKCDCQPESKRPEVGPSETK